MKPVQTLDYQVYRFGLWMAVITIVSGVVAMFLPLDAPGGFAATHADRVSWLSSNNGLFITAWFNQIVAMVALSSVFFCAAWSVARTHALRAILAGLVVAMSVMAFIIPKFIAVWTLPMLANTVAAGEHGADMADTLLLLLNVSVPFSLYTAFDYLGFWLYSVFALLVAGPLYGASMSSKAAALSLGLFGLIYQLLLVALWLGGISPEEVEGYFLGSTMLLLIHVIAMLLECKKAMSASISS